MAGTYRDEDGLIEQLRRRVKYIEEESLLVQGERGTDEGLLSLGPGGEQAVGVVRTSRHGPASSKSPCLESGGERVQKNSRSAAAALVTLSNAAGVQHICSEVCDSVAYILCVEARTCPNF